MAAAAGAEVGAAAEAMCEILRSDAQSERRSSEDEIVAKEFNGISCQGSVAGVARVVELEGKAARFMRAAQASRVESRPRRPDSPVCGAGCEAASATATRLRL